MFTGLIEAVGTIEGVTESGAGRELRVACPWDDLVTGESVAVNGACLTVLQSGPEWFTVGAISTTLERTTIGSWRAGTQVNLERALRLGDRLGGHLVQGHVDGVGHVRSVTPRETSHLVDIVAPPDLIRCMVPLGSLTVDGVSLTINAVLPDHVVQISLIPHTMSQTTLGSVRSGDRVNLEVDLIGKYVAARTGPYSSHLART